MFRAKSQTLIKLNKNAQRPLNPEMELLKTKMAPQQQQLASMTDKCNRIAPRKKDLIIFSKLINLHLLKFNAYVRLITVTRVG